jgi:hypothetical protein
MPPRKQQPKPAPAVDPTAGAWPIESLPPGTKIIVQKEPPIRPAETAIVGPRAPFEHDPTAQTRRNRSETGLITENHVSARDDLARRLIAARLDKRKPTPSDPLQLTTFPLVTEDDGLTPISLHDPTPIPLIPEIVTPTTTNQHHPRNPQSRQRKPGPRR